MAKRCENCGAQNPDSADFCHECGNKIGKDFAKTISSHNQQLLGKSAKMSDTANPFFDTNNNFSTRRPDVHEKLKSRNKILNWLIIIFLGTITFLLLGLDGIIKRKLAQIKGTLLVDHAYTSDREIEHFLFRGGETEYFRAAPRGHPVLGSMWGRSAGGIQENPYIFTPVDLAKLRQEDAPGVIAGAVGNWLTEPWDINSKQTHSTPHIQLIILQFESTDRAYDLMVKIFGTDTSLNELWLLDNTLICIEPELRYANSAQSISFREGKLRYFDRLKPRVFNRYHEVDKAEYRKQMSHGLSDSRQNKVDKDFAAPETTRDVASSYSGGKASASSYGSYKGSIKYPLNVNDGRIDTQWAGTSIPAWVMVTFDRIYAINRVRCVASYHTQRYEIQLSLDGRKWTTVATRVTPFDKPRGDDGGNDDFSISIPKQHARHARVLVTYTDAPGGHIFKAFISELQAFGF